MIEPVPKQILLPLGLENEPSFTNFITGQNQEIRASLGDSARGVGDRVVFLWGESGTGKTHLLKAVCKEARRQNRKAVYLPCRAPDSIKANPPAPHIRDKEETGGLPERFVQGPRGADLGACGAYGDRSEKVGNCGHSSAEQLTIGEDNSELFDGNLPETWANLPLSQPIHPKSDRFLGEFVQANLVCIDDIDARAGDKAWEDAFFHLYNLLDARGIGLLVTGERNPAGSAFSLRDLGSRLAAALVLRVHPLDDNGKSMALQCRARERGFTLSDKLIDFLLRRCHRDMHSLFALLDAIDEATLVEKRQASIPFVKRLLERGMA
uniref:DnaA regulatory inactivator Hda n=1 Tax=Candidatus Kentrum sp. FM TaxID=2126340 RepID=A0A450WXG2_9GAMM|nr:MAG: DnaA regulatory inactivator Hda [Candidatus Kentron sp. FM]VFJ75465.1 MAG: DnaA regulatory inactivator Hda [Candidatus Kentron sp. FM]VFK21679.1 MAG: DnaA regulatory inactivator Hda [Candidatus Kentron sp. FM]